jgi:hypothetical protein
MTDGSGNDHREYKPRKPTVWAASFEVALFVFTPTIYLSREDSHLLQAARLELKT